MADVEDKRADEVEDKRADEGEIKYGAATPEKLTSEKMEKKMKKVSKEGGKRGVEIEGAADMGGLQFFCTSVLEPQGDVDWLYESVKAMNKKCQPGEEERSGGSDHVGKMVISASEDSTKLAIVTYVPPSKQGSLKAFAWMSDLLIAMGGTGTILFADATSAKGVIENNPEKDIFVLKLKDSIIMQSIEYLKKKDLFPDVNDDSDDEYVFGDDDFPS